MQLSCTKRSRSALHQTKLEMTSLTMQSIRFRPVSAACHQGARDRLPYPSGIISCHNGRVMFSLVTAISKKSLTPRGLTTPRRCWFHQQNRPAIVFGTAPLITRGKESVSTFGSHANIKETYKIRLFSVANFQLLMQLQILVMLAPSRRIISALAAVFSSPDNFSFDGRAMNEAPAVD